MERKRLQSVAAEYPHLRGLFSIPVALLMIASGLGNLKWGPFSSNWAFFAFVGLAAVAAVACSRYYNENFGRVTLSRKAQIRGLAAAVVCVPLIVGGGMVDNNLDLPIWGFLAAWSVLMLVSYAASVGLKPHHIVLWGGMLIASLLPLWGGMSGDMRANAGLITAGLLGMVSGLFDHLLLVRSFGSLNAGPLNGNRAEA
jgi:hypothetical protein